jgi:phenol 2-monooxygenase
VKVERSLQPTTLSIDDSKDASHPVTVVLRHLSEDESTLQQSGTIPNGLFRSNIVTEAEVLEGLREEERLGEKGGEWDEVVKAKYVVGCDGARSWVRK